MEDTNGRINIGDLPQAEQELTTEEAKDVKGGLLVPAIMAAREAPRTTAANGATLQLQNGLTVVEQI